MNLGELGTGCFRLKEKKVYTIYFGLLCCPSLNLHSTNYKEKIRNIFSSHFSNELLLALFLSLTPEIADGGQM